jgi:hypothetical protein
MEGQNEKNDWLLPPHVQRKDSFASCLCHTGQKVKMTCKVTIVFLLMLGRVNKDAWGSESIIPRINWEKLLFTNRNNKIRKKKYVDEES